MLIKYTTGDMFQSGAECLVNTVNCEGYMGKGVAYQFKLKFPENNKSYIKACKDKTLHVGTIHTFVENGITIVNFPTKDKWRENSKISYRRFGRTTSGIACEISSHSTTGVWKWWFGLADSKRTDTKEIRTNR